MAEVTPAPKRQQILEAALGVFAEKGFHNAKIEEIAQAAQVGKGTVYEYFQSKKELFQETLKEGVSSFDNSLDAELAKERTTKGKLRVLIAKSIELGRNYQPLAKVAIMETTLREDAFRDWMIKLYRKRVGLIEAIIREGISRGEIRDFNTKLFTGLFYTALGALHSPFLEYDLYLDDEQAMVEQIIDFFYNGIDVRRGVC